METIRALIVDDEPLAREGILMRLGAEPDVEVVGECRNGREAVAAIRREAPDLVFLDIRMPRTDGFAVIEAVGADRMPHVIFVTAHDEYAIQAFEVHALDYLLKPVDGARFAAALARARERIRGQQLATMAAQLRQIIGELRGEREYLDRLFVKSGGRILAIDVDDIDWIEAADNYVHLHTGRASHLLLATMNGLEARLDPRRFLRIHRSTIVNLGRVKELRPMFHGEYRVVLGDGAVLTSGRRYAKSLHKLVQNL
jgi:two-component system, LytTR family, response regulator